MTYVSAAVLRRGRVGIRLDRRAAMLAVSLALAPVLAVNGGYFPTSWGWMAVGFAWAAALALLLGEPARLGRPEWLFVGGLGVFAAWTAVATAWSQSPTQTVLETQRLLCAGRSHAGD